MSARELLKARLENWIIPASIDDESLLFAVIDEENQINEIHENNNKAWSLRRNDAVGITSTEDIYRDNLKHSQENLVRVYPNPMKDQATFSYELVTEARVEISIYNFQGQCIKTVPNEHWPAGSHSRTVDISDLDDIVQKKDKFENMLMMFCNYSYVYLHLYCNLSIFEYLI